MPNDKSPTRSRPSRIIRRKVMPPPLPAVDIRRDRLDRLIVEVVESHSVTVIAARAGSGKTTAVRHALSCWQLPLAWLSVDRTDAAPGRLLVYLESALSVVVPSAAGVVASALAEGLSHPEAAGLLAEAIDRPLVLVLDDLERLGDSSRAWSIVEAFVRYAPELAHTVMLSRREIPPSLCMFPSGTRSAVMRERALAFTVDEARDALATLAIDGDASEVVASTQGWVAGVLFDSGPQRAGGDSSDDARDPLHGYLSRHILEQLSPDAQEFLITTALLDEVDERGAVAVGGAGAAGQLAALRDAHLPVTWTAGHRAMRCHPRFREFLLELLELRAPDEVHDLRRRHALLLAKDGYAEEATEELLRIGAIDDALPSAERAILGVIDRLDFTVAERWLAAFASHGRRTANALDVAELMLAIGRGDFRRGAAVGDRLAAAGQRDALVAGSQRAAVLLAWCYAGAWRHDQLQAVVAVAGPSDAMDAVLYSEHLVKERSDRPRPTLTGGAADGLVFPVDLVRGHLGELAAGNDSRWQDTVSSPWRISALLASGRTEEALELYEEGIREGVAEAHLTSMQAPDLFMDLGRTSDALDAILRGRRLVARNGASWAWFVTLFAEAKLRLRHERDIVGGLAALDHVERELDAMDLRPHYIEELTAMWRGLALLIDGDGAAARHHLEFATSGLVTGGRYLDVPTAATYLSEARWRTGDEDGADEAADLALDAARRQGSNHLLLQALSDFPGVASRRLDALTDPESRWHEIGRTLFTLHRPDGQRPDATVVLTDFGPPELHVAGTPRRPRIAKSYELFAYLLSGPSRRCGRDELLGELFEGRGDASARAYLRQAISELRKALPGENDLIVTPDDVELSDQLDAGTLSARFEALRAQAMAHHGAERLATLRETLSLFERGPYLAGVTSRWAEDRQRRLTDLASDARHDAAELELERGAYGEALELVDHVLREEPMRERAWRLKMRIADMLGDSDGVLRAYRDCVRELSILGVEPTASTRDLLVRLRR
jgi:DNA-binding SARP family transcriptional activator